MVKVRKDLTGQKFGRLTVIRQAEDYVDPKGRHCAKWICRCECENIVSVTSVGLTSGNTQSCGCIRREQITTRNKRVNSYEICDNYVVLYTTKGEPFYVDLEDFEKIKDICWYISDEGYITGSIKGKKVRLHRYIMNCPDNMDVDHIHGCLTRNDNRKENLRIVTRSQNLMNTRLKKTNTSGVTGVNWHKASQKWRARITVGEKEIYLGIFDNFEDAVKVRKEAEEKYFGEYSYGNSQSA